MRKSLRFKKAGRFSGWLMDKIGIVAIVLPWGTCLHLGTASPALRVHENVHWRQYKELGVVRFILTYLYQLIRYGYEKHPMEIEAREETLMFILGAVQDQGPSGPPACSITLTGDIAAVFGGQPLDISGQTVSKTVPESPAEVYAAGGTAVPVSWSGWRAFAYKASDFTLSGTNTHGLHAISLDGSSVALSTLFGNATGQWGFYATGFAFAVGSGSFDDKCGIRINGGTGDAEIYVGSHVFTKEAWAELGGMFLGKSPAPVATLGNPFSGTLFTAGDTYAAQIFTAAADLTDVGFPAGTLDWCGNLIS